MAGLAIQTVQAVNRARCKRWHGEDDAGWTGADWGNAMGGECGEAQNVVKKLRRHETHLGTSYNTPEVEELLPKLGEEIADTILYALLLADHYGIDVATEVARKFNKVSVAQGFPERLSA